MSKAYDKALERANTELIKEIAEPTKEVVEEATQEFVRKRGRGR